MPIWVVESNENLDSTMCPRFHVDEFVWSVFQPTLRKNLDFVLNLAKVSIDGVEELLITDFSSAETNGNNNNESPSNGSQDLGQNLSSDKLYDKQSTKWVRTKPSCLSDFTGRPVLFDLCEPHCSGAKVLDVGCGEGYCARKLIEMGVSYSVGIDISEEMVNRATEAISLRKKDANQAIRLEKYFSGSATDMIKILSDNSVHLQPLTEDPSKECFLKV